MINPRPSSSVVRFLLETRYVRHYGRKLVKTYRTQTDDGSLIYVRTDTDDEDIVDEIFKKRVYEKYFASSEGYTVVDVGANSGFFTLRTSELVGNSGHVIAFEPYSKSFSLLQKHLRINNRLNVNPMRLALGSTPRTERLNLYKLPGNNSFYDKTAFYGKKAWLRQIGSEEVAVETLDSVVSKLKPSRIDIVKIDTEGSELEVLKGATETLRNFHPKIVAETHPYGASCGEIEDFLTSFRYSTKCEDYPMAEKLLYAW